MGSQAPASSPELFAVRLRNFLGLRRGSRYPFTMGSKAQSRRRWAGAFVLAAAFLMLVAGETVLRDRLDGIEFIVFWLICLLFTCLAIIIAFLDLSAIRRKTREEQRALFESTMKDIVRSSAGKSRNKEKNNQIP